MSDFGVKANPLQSERVHQVIGNIIHTFELEYNYMDDDDPWKGILSETAFAVQSTFHTTVQNIPGQLVFGRDMILNVKHEANWEYVQERKQKHIEKNNKADNAKHIPPTYEIGDSGNPTYSPLLSGAMSRISVRTH